MVKLKPGDLPDRPRDKPVADPLSQGHIFNRPAKTGPEYHVGFPFNDGRDNPRNFFKDQQG